MSREGMLDGMGYQGPMAMVAMKTGVRLLVMLGEVVVLQHAHQVG